MNTEEVRKLLMARLQELTSVPQELIQYPNFGEKIEPNGRLWVDVSFQPGLRYMSGMADKPTTRLPGRLIVSVKIPDGEGMRKGTEVESELSSLFAFWSSGDLECWEVYGSNGGTSGGYYSWDVTIRFVAG